MTDTLPVNPVNSDPSHHDTLEAEVWPAMERSTKPAGLSHKRRAELCEKRLTIAFVVMVLALVAVAVGMVLWAVFGRKGDVTSPSPLEPDHANDSNSTHLYYHRYRNILSNHTSEEALNDRLSAQSLALQWLVVRSNVDNVEDHLLQRYALLVLAFSCLGQTSEWLGQPHLHECSWSGVTCTNKSVSGLRLREFEMSGRLPGDLTLLSTLRELNVGRNRLEGPIPAALYALTQLETLSLNGNRFFGPINDKIGALTNIEILDLKFNVLTGTLPSTLSNLTAMRVFDVSNNKLSGTVFDIALEWPLLERLLVGKCIWNDTLRINMSTWSSLETLDASNAYSLTGPIPSEIGLLSNLEDLILSGNPTIGGSLPSEFLMLKQLKVLDLDRTGLSGTLASGDWPNQLERLQLTSNELTGTVPSELSTLIQLKILFLEDNDFHGTLPDLSALTNLEELELRENPQLSGTIPSSFCLLHVKIGIEPCKIQCDCCLEFDSLVCSLSALP